MVSLDPGLTLVHFPSASPPHQQCRPARVVKIPGNSQHERVEQRVLAQSSSTKTFLTQERYGADGGCNEPSIALDSRSWEKPNGQQRSMLVVEWRTCDSRAASTNRNTLSGLVCFRFSPWHLSQTPDSAQFRPKRALRSLDLMARSGTATYSSPTAPPEHAYSLLSKSKKRTQQARAGDG
jgi:hypothetical protein